MTYQQLIADLKKKDYKPMYLLHGTESYFIDKITQHVENKVLSEAEKGFNFTVLYGKETNFQTIVDVARRYPMMAERQVVILKEAQQMRDLSKLDAYAKQPTPTTLLLICHKHKKLDARTAFAKAIKKNGVIFESKKLYDNQVPEWIVGYLKDRNYTISPEACRLVADFLGTDLSKIANELEKLSLNVAAGTKITPKHVEDNIGISKDYNVFELTKALGAGDTLKATRIANYFAANPKDNPMPVIVGALYNYFSKLYICQFLRNSPDDAWVKALKLRNNWFLKEYKAAIRTFNKPKTEHALAVIKEYDLKSKGVDRDSTPEGELVREMVWKIVNF